MTKTKETEKAEDIAGCGNRAVSLGTEVLNARTFNFMGTDVRVVMKGDEPWFAANDVSNILGLSNPRSSLSLLDDDEKGVHTVDTLGGKQDVTIISEAGMYTLALRSRKPQAKPFRRWVTHEVLPAINRTGVYAAPASTLQEATRIIDQIIDDPLAWSSLSSKIVARINPAIVVDAALRINTAQISRIERDAERITRQIDELTRQVRGMQRPAAKNYRIIAVEEI